MTVINDFFTVIWDGFGIEMNIYGFTFSFRDIFVYTLLAFLVVGFFAQLFDRS